MAINYQSLKTELISDPLGRGYSGFTDEQAMTDLNTVYRTRTVTTVPGSAIFNATDDTEYSALTDVEKDRWLALCAVLEIDVSSGVAKALEAEIFGPGTTTRSNLSALKTEDISRAEELGFGVVKTGDVEYARAL